jgi:CHAT domain-containing protein
MVAVQRAAKELYDQTMGQLEEVLKDQSKLYVAADGDLGLIDFGSLIDRKGRWFVEEHLVVNLTSGRDLVRLKRADAERKGARGDYLVANPSFLFKDARAPRNGATASAAPAGATLGSSGLRCSAAFGKGGLWPRIGITKEQIGGFRTALPGLKVYEREQARESVVKQIERPRTLWFITHGFFCESADAASGPGGNPTPSAERRWDDPLTRGALVLAGGQVGGLGDGEDGYLQGTEIVDRNWGGTELVVLGACETALGVPRIGDGVYGMRRAFALAGVRSQVMTLWRVSQAHTFELLASFANHLHAGKGKAEALREAQREMLKKHLHPYYWAGFFFIGDPTPLRTP